MMSKKRIPKRRGGEKIKKRDLNEIFHLEIGLVSVFLLIGFFSLLFSSLEFQPIRNIFSSDITGKAYESCIDSDNGLNLVSKGEIKGILNGKYTTRTNMSYR